MQPEGLVGATGVAHGVDRTQPLAESHGAFGGEGAVPLLERVLAIDRSSLGPEHPQVAVVMLR